jgi:alpha-amylase
VRAHPLLLAFALLSGLSGLSACDGGGPTSGGGPVNPGNPSPPGPVVRPTLDPAYTPTGRSAAGDVAVQLFEWGWADVARECELHLGPMGYHAALVSPPQEHIAGQQWWTRYQPVSYSLDGNRSGTRAQFSNMVQRCATAGVEIYVDAVINHMSAGSGTGTNGTVYTKYSYPGLYSAADFHPACGINDWGSAAQVQECELVGLSDLNTSSSSVQQRIVTYMADLVQLGVRGFRIDAAKHIQPVELDSIIAKLGRAADALPAPRPYVFLEIIDMGGAGPRATEYLGVGNRTAAGSDISEFKFRGIGDKFQGVGGQRVSELTTFSQSNWGLLPSNKAMTFLQNHDTQRSGGLRWGDGNTARIANVFMLAEPYGYPMVMSGYSFDPNSAAARDAGPPPPNGTMNGQDCAADPATAGNGVWLCEHRDPWLAQMIRFRAAAAGTARTNNWDNGTHAVAFSRGSEGFVIVNNASTSITVDVPTGLAAGTYCDLLAGGLVAGACAGQSFAVAGGQVTVTVMAKSAVVLLRGDQP